MPTIISNTFVHKADLLVILWRKTVLHNRTSIICEYYYNIKTSVYKKTNKLNLFIPKYNVLSIAGIEIIDPNVDELKTGVVFGRFLDA